MILPDAPPSYGQGPFNQILRAIKNGLDRKWQRGSNIDLSNEEITLVSPDGSRWAITVDDTGALSAVARP